MKFEEHGLERYAYSGKKRRVVLHDELHSPSHRAVQSVVCRQD